MEDQRSGDSVLEEWHGRFGRAVSRWFGARCRSQTAEDLAQKTWAALAATLARGGYDAGRSAPSTFVYAVMHNIWRQHAAALARAGTGVAEGAGADERAAPGSPDLPDAVAEAEELDRVRFYVGERSPLDAATREVLRLVGAGATDRDLAVWLGVSASTAHARKRAALERLRGALEEGGRAQGGPV